MIRFSTLLAFFFLISLPSMASPDPDGDHQLLPTFEDTETLRTEWTQDGKWTVSPIRSWLTGGTRAGVYLIKNDDRTVRIQTRGIDGRGNVGPWIESKTTWAAADQQINIAELGGHYPQAQLRISTLEAVGQLGWEIRIPIGESDSSSQPPPPNMPGLSQNLVDIGVISRSQWGARQTTCTSTEDDWYRMVVHHTAGAQSSGGSVQTAVQGLQAWSMDSGGFCDIPYQYLVGHDGSLWEGRPSNYYSGATYGENNGNIAVCFLGCYDSPNCDNFHEPTNEMMAWGRVLANTLAEENDFTLNNGTFKGHRDTNATACPGQELYDRLDEMESQNAPYQAQIVQLSHTETIELERGESIAVWVEAQNTGQRDWDVDGTRLAPLPRDQYSAVSGSDWILPNRVTGPDDNTASGQQVKFSFSLNGNSVGEYELRFALLQEGLTWFSDIPFGGGPGEDEIVFRLNVREPVDDTGDDSIGDSETPDDDMEDFEGLKPKESEQPGACSHLDIKDQISILTGLFFGLLLLGRRKEDGG